VNGNGQGHIADSPRLAALRAKLQHAEAARDAAKAALTDEDRAEIEIREQLARAEDDVREQDRTRRKLDLDRRLEEAQQAYPSAKLAAVMIKGFPDTFIVKHDGKAFARFQQEAVARQTSSGKKGPSFEESRLNYALSVIIDWNGITDWSPTNSNGHDLRTFLKANSGVATPVTDAAWELAGSAAEESKSAG